MEKLKGYLIYGKIYGQGNFYYKAPWATECIAVKEGEIYKFYDEDEELIFEAYSLKGEKVEWETDSLGNKIFKGYYWDFMDDEDVKHVINDILGENETFEDWLKKKHERCGVLVFMEKK